MSMGDAGTQAQRPRRQRQGPGPRDVRARRRACPACATRSQ
ncbi:hypothetical protein [Nocardioides convexus]|nr:hypothetical protein [Nocardioides convexus]